ncbi:MAG TPA: hypothetical protein VKX28_29390 [Xanthobacteraceae bacterium]|nr:hypothetical protein [Xanthobacteraceae bacterium]
MTKRMTKRMTTKRMTTRIIRIGARRQYAVVVDAVDYAWLRQWKWSFTRFCWKYGVRIYARRCVMRGGRKIAVYMHRVILAERMRRRRPSPTHTCDHRDNDSLDNTRRNLAWATPSEQRINQRRRITRAEAVAYEVADAGCGRSR